MTELQHVYESKETSYFQSPREDLIELVNGTGLTVLDIGCGAGATGKRWLETSKAKWVTGIELIPSQASIARQSLKQVLVGDISQIKLDWPPGHFDCIIAGDVLERLANLGVPLEKTGAVPTHRRNAHCEHPTMRHWWVVRDLVVRREWHSSHRRQVPQPYKEIRNATSSIQICQ
jgi:SAM-dependent methyltransferase